MHTTKIIRDPTRLISSEEIMTLAYKYSIAAKSWIPIGQRALNLDFRLYPWALEGSSFSHWENTETSRVGQAVPGLSTKNDTHKMNIVVFSLGLLHKVFARQPFGKIMKILGSCLMIRLDNGEWKAHFQGHG
jgi:hypothetical protein